MFNNIFLKLKNKNDIDYIYKKEIVEEIKKADEYIDNIFTFDHPLDMERCTKKVKFDFRWHSYPFDDPEWMWMLNRMRFLETISRAYFITDDEKYFFAFKKFITHWIENNKDPVVHAKTSCRRIDTGIRIEHWIKSIEYISKSRNFDIKLKNEIKKSLIVQGEYIAKNVSSFSKTSNWGVLEFHGLFLLSLFLKDYKQSSQWLKLSTSFLMEAIDTQFLADDVQWEMSPMYHNEVCHCYTNFLFLCERFNIVLATAIKEKIKNILRTNVYWMKPNYHQPLLGDSDDTDLRDILTYPSCAFKDSILKTCAYEKILFEDYFTLGINLSEEYTKLKIKNPENISKHFETSGIVVMRDSYSKNSSYISFVSKRFGGGHNHDDLLHFSFFANNKDYLIDCGRYSYTECKERRELKQSFGHNTIIINGRENSSYKDSWTNVSDASFIEAKYFSSNGIEIVFSYNTSYIDIGVIVKRSIIKLNKEIFLVLDAIETNSQINIELKFNTPLKPELKNDKIKIDDFNFIFDNRLKTNIKNSYYSPHYNEKAKSYKIIQKIKTKNNVILPSLFTFEKAKIEDIKLISQLENGTIDDTVARGLKIKLAKDEYIILYRAFLSAKSRGYFLGYNDKFYSNEYTIIKNGRVVFEY